MTTPRAVALTGWGRVPPASACGVTAPRGVDDLDVLTGAGDLIARGNGRAYGDSAMNPRRVVDLRGLRRLLAFDSETGRLEAEAGVLLADIIDIFLPRGWFPQVVPGTRLVTLGGMIAADVHGKNHHRDGSMRQCLDWIDLRDGEGTVRRLRSGEPLFEWTVGGMGLTGMILRAGLRLRKVGCGWMRQTTVAAPDLRALMAAMEAGVAPYSVAWIDSLATGTDLGRGLLQSGEHADPDDFPPGANRFPGGSRTLALPAAAPGWAMGRPLVRAFNSAVYWRGLSAPASGLVDWARFFFPLDRLRGWNRLYGRCGFVQFQCVLPEPSAAPGLAALLVAVAGAGHPSPLAVLKKMGPEAGPFSFPMAGWTLAIDLSMRPETPGLMNRLHAIAIDHGGRFYLAKDALLTAEALTRSDPRADAFRAMRREQGLGASFRSLQSERLEL